MSGLKQKHRAIGVRIFARCNCTWNGKLRFLKQKSHGKVELTDIAFGSNTLEIGWVAMMPHGLGTNCIALLVCILVQFRSMAARVACVINNNPSSFICKRIDDSLFVILLIFAQSFGLFASHTCN